MAKVKAAAIYARISSDPEGTALGVNRQLQDCRALAAELGWSVAEEYVDNDISAFSGKPRPAYLRMLRDVSDGRRDAVIVYAMDRLMRRPIELEEFAQVLDAAGAPPVKFVKGDTNMQTGDGLFVARVLGAFAAMESDTKSRRVKRKMQERAEAGLPHGTGTRPFGYELDGMTIRESEAIIIRDLAARFVAGESWRALCVWLAAEGIETARGGRWSTTTLRNVLTGGRIAGLRTHQGEVIGKAAWPAIITPQMRRRVLLAWEGRKISGKRAIRTYLLSGLLSCGSCGNRLYSSRRERGIRRYVCASGPDHHGCGKLSIVAEPLEQFLTDALLLRLDSPQLARNLAAKTKANQPMAKWSEQASKARQRLDDLALAFADGEIDRKQLATATAPLRARIEEAERHLAADVETGPLRSLIGRGADLRAGWDGLTLDRQHAIVSAVCASITIARGTRGATSLDPARVQVRWTA